MSNNVSTPANQADPILAEHAVEIRQLGKRVIADVIEIGRRLTECKRICGHGNWLPWLDREFGWSADTAENYIAIFKRIGPHANSENSRNLNLPVHSLRMLAAKSTPETTRTDIIERAQSGEVILPPEVKRRIDAAKSRKPPAERTDLPAVYRADKLGAATIDKLKGTSLASAREQDKLVLLNRGAEEGELKPIVRQLVADASAGKNVSAIAVYMNYGAPLPRDDDDDTGANSTGKIAQKDDELEELRAETTGDVETVTPSVDGKGRAVAEVYWDIGASLNNVTASPGEIKRLGARNEELENRCRRLELKIGRLNQRIADLEEQLQVRDRLVEKLQRRLGPIFGATAEAPEKPAPASASDGLDIPDFLDRTRAAPL